MAHIILLVALYSTGLSGWYEFVLVNYLVYVKTHKTNIINNLYIIGDKNM